MRIVAFVVCLIPLAYCRHLPSYLEPCKRTDPDISKCIIKNVDILRPKFDKGVPELGIPPFNPLTIPEAHFNGGSFNVSFKNIEIYNLDSFSIDSLYFDPFKPEFKLAIKVPVLRIKATYTVKGRVLVLVLDGSGPLDGNYTNIYGVLEANGEHYNKNGKDHVKLGNYTKIDVDIGKPHLQFDNIFGDNQELNDRTNQLFNENVSQLVDEIKPLMIQVISQFVFGVENRVFDRYSFDELFPL